MTKPPRSRVLNAIRRDCMPGKKKYLEAVQLRDGTMVVRYQVELPVKRGIHKITYVEQRIVVESKRHTHNLITESWFE